MNNATHTPGAINIMGKITIPVNEPTSEPLKEVPITRAALIEKLIEYRSDDWDHHDTDDVLEFGRIGFIELSNEDLEQIALDYMLEEGGVEVAYTITDPCPIKATPEEINQEMLEACRRAFATLTDRDDDDLNDTDKQTIVMLGQAIAKAEGNPA